MNQKEFDFWQAVTASSESRWVEDAVTRLNGNGSLYYAGGVDGIYMRLSPEGKLSVGTYEGAIPHIGEACFIPKAEHQYLNIYADYDMERQQVCDDLSIVLWKGDGQTEEMSYTLNAAEKEVVRRAMDEHCLKQTGMALRDYAAQRMAEDASPMMEPTM